MSSRNIDSQVHMSTLGSGLWELQRQQMTTDAWLYCTEELISVHRAVLAACSPYFRQVISAVAATGGQPVVILPRAKPELMRKLLQYMYMGSVDVPETDVEGLESLARYFKMQDFCDALHGVKTLSNQSSPFAATSSSASSSVGGRGGQQAQLQLQLAALDGSSSSAASSPAVAKKGRMRGPKRARRRQGMAEDDDEEGVEEVLSDEPLAKRASTVAEVNGGSEDREVPAKKAPKGRRSRKSPARVGADEDLVDVATGDDDVPDVDSDVMNGNESIEVDGLTITPPKGLLKNEPVEKISWRTCTGFFKDKGSKKKLFFCAEAGCQFKSKLRMGIATHEKAHARDAPNLCPQCPSPFDDFDDLVEHVQLMHRDDPKEEERRQAENMDEEMEEEEEVGGGDGDGNPLQIGIADGDDEENNLAQGSATDDDDVNAALDALDNSDEDEDLAVVSVDASDSGMNPFDRLMGN